MLNNTCICTCLFCNSVESSKLLTRGGLLLVDSDFRPSVRGSYPRGNRRRSDGLVAECCGMIIGNGLIADARAPPTRRSPNDTASDATNQRPFQAGVQRLHPVELVILPA